jgi:DNA recombination protein Rad52
MDWNLVSEKLSQPLDQKNVVKPSGKFGPQGDYIEGWHAINEANRIFGFDGWSYSINLIKDSLVEGVDRNSNPQWQAAYTCICTVKVDGVTRQDVGFGSGFAKQVGDAIEGATKEAVTDALKRCLRTFGNPFGLALYDKSKSNVVDAEAEAAKLAGQQEAVDNFITQVKNGLPSFTNALDLDNALKGIKDKLSHLAKNFPDKHQDLMTTIQARQDQLNTQMEDAA